MAMRRYSVFVLLLLGVVVIAAGSFELLRETGVFTGGLDIFGSLLIVVLGLWIITCGIECRTAYESDRKS
jgi:hypothetical protein